MGRADATQGRVGMQFKVAAGKQLDAVPVRRAQPRGRRRDAAPHLRDEVEEIAGVREVERVARFGEQEHQRVGDSRLAATADHEQALQRMERRGEDDGRIAHARARSGEGGGAVEVEGVEVAVPRPFDKAVGSRLDAEAVANVQRRAGASVRAPGQRRQQRERLVLDLQDATPLRSGRAGACRSCIRPANAARSHSRQPGR